jgi:hypothetical protein
MWKEAAMSNRPKKPANYRQLFPSRTPLQSIFELHEKLMKRATHVVHIEDHGWRHFAVVCTCGYDAPAPFGEQQAEHIKENHLARYGLIKDPLGAKYRS